MDVTSRLTLQALGPHATRGGPRSFDVRCLTSAAATKKERNQRKKEARKGKRRTDEYGRASTY